MSAQGAAVMALAGEIVEALLADEKDGGYDLTAGLFGSAFSALVRRWAAAETTLQVLGQAKPYGYLSAMQFWEATNPRLDEITKRYAKPLYSHAVPSEGIAYFMGASLVNGQFTGVLQRRDPDGTVTVVDTVQTSEAALREGGCFSQLRGPK